MQNTEKQYTHNINPIRHGDKMRSDQPGLSPAVPGQGRSGMHNMLEEKSDLGGTSQVFSFLYTYTFQRELYCCPVFGVLEVHFKVPDNPQIPGAR